MHHDAFQALSLAMCAGTVNKIRHNGMRKECSIRAISKSLAYFEIEWREKPRGRDKGVAI
jgi:hypothetical protein